MKVLQDAPQCIFM